MGSGEGWIAVDGKVANDPDFRTLPLPGTSLYRHHSPEAKLHSLSSSPIREPSFAAASLHSCNQRLVRSADGLLDRGSSNQ